LHPGHSDIPEPLIAAAPKKSLKGIAGLVTVSSRGRVMPPQRGGFFCSARKDAARCARGHHSADREKLR
jgi:hypothetical protein